MWLKSTTPSSDKKFTLFGISVGEDGKSVVPVSYMVNPAMDQPIGNPIFQHDSSVKFLLMKENFVERTGRLLVKFSLWFIEIVPKALSKHLRRLLRLI